jgi:16S rRNA (guanine(966)-N(2))-methyltransferase RsmD
VKEAMFDLLGPGPFQGPALDLFAGSGALGIEALSRGFGPAVFVEQERPALDLIQANLRACRFEARARLVRGSAEDFLRTPAAEAPFALILADPPYRQGLAPQVLERLGQDSWLAQEGWVLVEVEKGLSAPAGVGVLSLDRERRYGDTALWVYRRVR